VAGSFNGWDTSPFAMEKGEEDIWSVTVELTPGVYEYKLVVNGDNWINDPANDIIAGNDGNNQLILPGLIIEGDKDVEPGATVTLTATYVNDEGEKEVVDADFALATEIAGVTIAGNKVTISEDTPPATEIKVNATLGDNKASYSIFVVGEMYEYTINYMRPDGQQADWGLWLWTADVNGSAYAFGEESTGGYVQSTVSFASDKLNLITRLGNWDSQEADRVITIPEGEKSVEVWIVGGNPEVYYSLDDVELLDQRYIELTYVRKNNDYEDWNLWVWGTGVKDDEILFDEITDKGAVVRIPVGYLTTEVGFKIRKGDWVEEDPFNEDRYIEIPIGEMISKVTIEEGKGEYFAVPSIDGPVLEDGNATFFYRDPELFLASEMDKIEQVQLSITKEETADAGAFATFTRNIVELFRTNANTEVYDMTYDAVNEYYVHTIEDIEAGNYDYTYLVTIDGETEEVVDPYNTNEDGHSTLLFAQPTVTAETSINPKAISYNENAVVTIASEVSDDYELRAAYIDLTPVGGPERVAINTELMEHTIAVKNTIEPGVKTLNIVLVDEFGNRHNSTVDVEVKSRQIKDDADFDWDEARIYFMLTDRFSNSEKPEGMPSNELSESYHGGDFQGVINNLDYLEELGINTIWITPIVDNIDDGMEMANGDKRYGYHGYWAKDFTKIDEHLGDVETLKNLVDSAHERGMKIMVDVVLNHAGYGMNDAEQFDGMIRDNPVAGDDIIGELSGLPDFRTEDPAVREQVIQWQIDWITELQEFTTDNDNTIDYFRVDTVKHVDNTTWNAFKNELTKIKPDFKMIGEWYGASVNNTGDQLRSGRMDSLLDFNFKGQAERFINGNIAEIEAELATRNGLIDNTAMMGQFLSSHDEDGFLVTRAAGNEGLFKVAAALQMTAKGQPVIYYGEELGQSGLMNDESVGRYYDENRYNLDWSIANDENDMLTHYKKLLNIRADYSDVFSKGTRQHVAGTNETGYSVFARTYGNEQIFVGLNTNEDAVESTFAVNSTSNARVSTFALGLAAGSEVIDVYNDVTYVVAADGTVTIDIPGNADGGTVILVAGDTVEEPVDPEEPVEPETPGDDRLDKIANRLEDLETAIDEITTNNLALVEELNVIRAEYERLRGLDAVTDAKIADLLARIAALEAIVADIGSESLGTGTDTPGVGGEEADGSDTDDSTEEDAATDSEEDNLPLTGETNSLMVSIIGLVFIGSGVALAFTFKKDERKE
ncbi:alpha-amylase family glycosyl hydrolase, partial [Jeotgalibaca porci]|uniref:alpha-amylase family glycosyl hydrolase n=1 Tax=Jeotgalibaca porci TaxID=1868793 RepID=UPI0035A17C88